MHSNFTAPDRCVSTGDVIFHRWNIVHLQFFC